MKKRLEDLKWEDRPPMTITVQDPPSMTVVIGLGYLLALIIWLLLLMKALK